VADTVAEVVSRAQGFLNDAAGQIWDATSLLPHVKTSLGDVTLELMSEGIERLRSTSATLSLAANVLALTPTSTPPLPTDFVSPIEMWERPVGGAVHDWQKMTLARANIPLVDQEATLRFWQWEGGKIVLVGATGPVEVMIDYVSAPADVTSGADPLPFTAIVNVIAYHVAELAYGSRGDEMREAKMGSSYREQLGNYINAAVRLKQRKPQRRKPARRRLAIY
jgi:hypothetical protein